MMKLASVTSRVTMQISVIKESEKMSWVPGTFIHQDAVSIAAFVVIVW